MLMGDFTAKVGYQKDENHVLNYGFRNHNERGDTLVQFCKEINNTIAYVQFKLPPRRLYKWKSPAGIRGRSNKPVKVLKEKYWSLLGSIL